MSNKYSNKQFN